MASRMSASDWCFEMKPCNPAAKVARMVARVSKADIIANWVDGDASRAAFRKPSSRLGRFG